jgi:hypothetical protein
VPGLGVAAPGPASQNIFPYLAKSKRRALGMSNATRFRVIFHPPVCPVCDGTRIEDQDVDTGGGITETAHVCLDCGEAWPIACVCDWDAPRPIPFPESPEGRNRPCPSPESAPVTAR